MKAAGSEETGRLGENLACAFLQRKGHTILERNKRIGHLEIDIISVDTNGIHFVEVKTRKRHIQQRPEECVGRTKQQRLVKAAARFLRDSNDRILAGRECFFDIVGVILYDGDYEINYIEQAFIPLYYNI